MYKTVDANTADDDLCGAGAWDGTETVSGRLVRCRGRVFLQLLVQKFYFWHTTQFCDDGLDQTTDGRPARARTAVVPEM